jgi:hypothetical protein
MFAALSLVSKRSRHWGWNAVLERMGVFYVCERVIERRILLRPSTCDGAENFFTALHV